MSCKRLVGAAFVALALIMVGQPAFAAASYTPNGIVPDCPVRMGCKPI